MRADVHLFERLPQIAEPGGVAEAALAGVPVRARPLVGVIRNARSHRNRGRELDLPADGAEVILATPEKRAELPAILAGFAARQVDYIVVDGGDGTVRDVLTCGEGAFGDSWPPLIVLPSGKTNALGLDLGLPPDWSLEQALAAAARGACVRRQPLVVAERGDERAQVRGFVLGAGAFTRAITLGQRSHKLGAFNAAVVALTTLWSVAQALFGRAGNPWRLGTDMRLRLADGSDLPHRGGLPQHQRYLLFASTLERFPAGLNPFRGISEALRVAVMDNPRRGFILRLAGLAFGSRNQATLRRGGHLFGAETLELDLGGSFILDGEAFPPGDYRLFAGAPLRFVVP